MKHLAYFFSLLLIACSTDTTTPVEKKPTVDKLVRLSYESEAMGTERDFFVYLPKGYGDDSTKKWPVIFFLHGNGERGNGKDELDFVKHHGPLYEAWVQKRDLPFIIVVPQLPMYGQDSVKAYIRDRDAANIPKRLAEGVPERPDFFPTHNKMDGQLADTVLPEPITGPPYGWHMVEQDLLTNLEMVHKKYHTDKERVYLTGISYGGYGTWYMASKHPELFAAISPVVYWGHPDLMPEIAQANIPVWAFAGGEDPVVQVRYFYPGLNKLKESGHKGEVRFTVHEDLAHDAWKRVYAGDDLYQWFLEQTLSEKD